MEKVDKMQDSTRSYPDTVQVEPRLPFGEDFQAIPSLIGDAVVCTDEDGKIILFNRAAEVLFGYTSVAIIGAPIEAAGSDAFQRSASRGSQPLQRYCQVNTQDDGRGT